MISSSHSPSRYGWAATAASSSAITALAEAQPRGELGLDELRPRLLELRAVRGGPVARRGQQLATEAAQRRRAELGGAVLVAGVEPPRRGGGVAQHAQRVDLGRLTASR